MIVDKIENIDTYKELSANIKRTINYIKATDFTKMKLGKHEIDEYIFALVNKYETQENSLNILEAHKKYIDFQYILQGREIIEHEFLNNQRIHKEYNEENDYSLYYSTEEKNKIKFSEGMFSILFPDDLHMPGIINKESSEIFKIVFKILI